MKLNPAPVLVALLVAGAAPVAAAGRDTSTAAAETSGDPGAKRAEELKREIRRLRALDARFASAERSLLGEMDALGRDALIAERELDLARLREQQSAAQLAALEEQAAALELELDRARVGLRRALIAAYERRAAPELWALLASNEPLDLPRNLRRIAAVGEAHTGAIRGFEEARAALGRNRLALEAETAAQVRIRAELETRRQQALAARARKAEFLRGIVGRRDDARDELASAARELGRAIGSLGADPNPVEGTGFRARQGRLPWPAEGTIVSRFGIETHPRFHTLIEHPGLEIRTAAGAPVRAVHEAQVVYADWFKGYGLLVILAHGDSCYSLYAHLDSLAVERGDRVAAGDQVGNAGDSGAAEGTGLYFEIREGDRAVDPERWLRGRR